MLLQINPTSSNFGSRGAALKSPKENGPLRGHFVTSLTVMAMPHHHPVMMVTMPAVIAMHLGTCVHPVVIMPDHHFLGTCNRRCGNGDGAKRGNDKSKLLHDVLLVLIGTPTSSYRERSRPNRKEF
ncbi:MAG: hypothetical protein WDN50_12165 [Bradyrhizobium sp.]